MQKIVQDRLYFLMIMPESQSNTSNGEFFFNAEHMNDKSKSFSLDIWPKCFYIMIWFLLNIGLAPSQDRALISSTCETLDIMNVLFGALF